MFQLCQTPKGGVCKCVCSSVGANLGKCLNHYCKSIYISEKQLVAIIFQSGVIKLLAEEKGSVRGHCEKTMFDINLTEVQASAFQHFHSFQWHFAKDQGHYFHIH